MNFSRVVEGLKEGNLYARPNMGNNGEFIFLVKGSKFKVNRAPLNEICPEGTEIEYAPHIDLKNEAGQVCTWSPSNEDILAEDWKRVYVLDEEQELF